MPASWARRPRRVSTSRRSSCTGRATCSPSGSSATRSSRRSPRATPPPGTSVLTVHHLNNSRSQRVLWLLEELGVPYQIERYQRDPRTLRAPEALKRVHPLGKSPVVSDGQETIAESGAITEYLLDRYGAGRLRPSPGSAAQRRYTYWLHYAEGSAMPPLLLKLVFLRIPRARVPWYARPIINALVRNVQGSFIDPELTSHARHWEEALARAP